MEQPSFADIFTTALTFTIFSAAQAMYRENPVRSEIISVEELLRRRTAAYLECVLGYLREDDPAAIKEKFDNQMSFLDAITSPF